jgi:hypothetical protein
VVEKPNGTGRRKQLPEQPLSDQERQWPKIEPFGREEIEGVVCDRILDGRLANIESTRQLAALLEPLKAGPARLVECHHLAIQYQAIHW